MTNPTTPHPHGEGRLTREGPEIGEARAALLLLHGRGADARSMLRIGREVAADDVALLAPDAAGQTWYPRSFLAPRAENEPKLGSALRRVAELVEMIEAEGGSAKRTVVAGFSQGACLALDFAARHPRRFGGIVGWSGGLIGDRIGADAYDGSLDGTPVYAGSGDRDAHIPVDRVERTAEVLRALEAEVKIQIFEGMDHRVNDEELLFARELIERIPALAP